MCNPLNHITIGSPLYSQSLYCLNLRSKCIIQELNPFYVWGDNSLHIFGKNPLYNAEDNKSNSLLIPISPNNALFKSDNELNILFVNILYLYNYCKRTTCEGVGTLNFYLIIWV